MTREIDKQIVKKVFGIKADYREIEMWGNKYLVRDDGVGSIFVLPNYSTDIKAAWEVVEKLGYTFKIDKFYDLADDELSYTVEVYNGKTARYNSGYSAPMAICKAALKALDQPSSVKE